ncbi:hypothetical protein L873DRAFT_1826838 [Choiromyces venosus 120613-1]|uniref:DUF788-domain-containing protein n=1 Tax=Choiromyces venosus 120613-1 TaxID=1336337 RepID=A0A3N4JUT0_9PEZI|nr:hypothetical protein L873DRAFT_1826838 [Choiromyces venosus 120613-1]
MANKAAKQLARANTATLNRTHLTTLTLHTLFILYRLLYRSGSWSKYVILSLPSLVIEMYLERLGRPKYAPGGDGMLVSAGEDMEAKGVTEYMWDIVYVTWGVLGLVGVAGEWGWWVWAIVPMYAIYLAVGMYRGMSGMIPGMPTAATAPSEALSTGAQSNRQKKAEKRGGQKIRYN